MSFIYCPSGQISTISGFPNSVTCTGGFVIYTDQQVADLVAPLIIVDSVLLEYEPLTVADFAALSGGIMLVFVTAFSFKMI